MMDIKALLHRLLARATTAADPIRERIWISPRQAGMNVTHDTAMTFSAVYRAIGYISSQLAMMPWRVMQERPNGVKDLVPTHPVDRLLHKQPNPEMTAFTFRELLAQHALSWGNGYAEIEVDRANRPMALWPLSPDRVEVRRINGAVWYEVGNTAGEKTYIPAERMFHLHGPGFDGLVGYSVVSLAARAIGLGMAAEQFGSSFFANGTVHSGVLQHPENIGDKALENLRESWNKQYQGPQKAHKPLILEEGMKWQSISIPPEDAQFLQTRQFQVDEIARWYGLPPHKLQSMDKATFSNIEHQSIEVVTDALQPWAKRLEEEADRKLFSQRASFYTKLNMNSLMRGDVATRSTYYREMWNLGVFSVNEIRELEDMNPVPYGDKRFVQLNMTTLEKAGEEPVAAQPMEQQEEEEDTEEQQDEQVEEMANKIARREMFRVQDAAKRYEGDRDGFVEWMLHFFAQHEQYCAKMFLKASMDMTQAMQRRIPDARLRMLEYFDEGVPYPVDTVREEIIAMIKRAA